MAPLIASLAVAWVARGMVTAALETKIEILEATQRLKSELLDKLTDTSTELEDKIAAVSGRVDAVQASVNREAIGSRISTLEMRLKGALRDCHWSRNMFREIMGRTMDQATADHAIERVNAYMRDRYREGDGHPI